MVDKVKDKVKNEKPTVFNMAFLEGLDDLKNHPTNEQRYDKETCTKGWKSGKAECERLDKISGTDITKILAKRTRGIGMVEKYIKSNVCPLPWTHLEVDVNGGASPCCLYKGNVPDVKVYKKD